MKVLFLILLFVLGACFGSFLCCQARRLRIREQAKRGTTKIKQLSSRSVCLNCGYQLKWYDNLPIISWLFLRGKCRKCKKKIGLAEIFAELGLALAFLAIGTTINIEAASVLDWSILIMTLLLTLTLGFLAIYDGLYGELPSLCLTTSIICAIIVLSLKEWRILSNSTFTWDLIWKPILSITILGGLYLVLYLVSKGKWVGDGDWLLGLAIGLALYDPWLALITLFVANVLACLIMFPFVKGKKQKKIYFGPFMVIAFIIVVTFSREAMDIFLAS